MRTPFFFSLIGFLVVGLSPVSAALSDVEIKVVREKLGEDISRKDGDTRVSKKEILYNITIQSKTFKDLSKLTAKYMIFYYDSSFGSTEKAEEKSKEGSENILFLKGNTSVTFKTDPIILITEQLDGNVVWANGASSRSKDRVSGIWVRVYNEQGEIVEEYANPSSITKRVWKE